MRSFELRRSKPPSKNYYAHWSEGRRSKSWSTRADDKVLARERALAYLTELYSPADAKAEDLLINDVLRGYQDDMRGELHSEETADRTFNHLVDYYKGRTVAYITKGTNKDYEIDRREFGWANSTINRYRNTLRAALKHRMKAFAPNIPTLPVTKKKERWLALWEAHKLLRAVLPRRFRYLNLFIRIGLGTGARHEAILALKWDQVDLETGRIDFRPRDKKGNILPETKKKRPHAPVSKRLLRYLKVAYRFRRGVYVVMHRGDRLLSVKRAFGEACKRAKIKGVTPHTMKHTYITWLLRARQSVWDVAGLTNTSVETITRVYGHHVPDDLAAAANAVSFISAEIVPN